MFKSVIDELKRAPPTRETASLVVLFDHFLDITLDEMRAHLDAAYPGEFLPAREQGNFVVAESDLELPYMICSSVTGGTGLFLYHNIPSPYWIFADFLPRIADSDLRHLAEMQSCWLSVDCIGGSESDFDSYAFIARSLAQIAPADAAVLVHPSRLTAVKFTDDIRHRLALGEPVL